MTKVLRRKSRKVNQLSTIDDVASLAGVSTATVSRFLNNPTIVAAKTGDKVRDAIAQLNYVPNALAGSLASSNSQAVAILVPHLTNSIVEETVETLVERLSRAGTVPFVGVTGLDAERTHSVLLAALSRRVSALITTGLIDERARKLLLASETTVVEIWGLKPDPVDFAIGFSHLEVGRALARYVRERGYERPHVVTAQGTRAQRRSHGFIETWREDGGKEPTEAEVPIPSHYGHAPALLDALLKLDEMPDVVVTGSDYLAHGLILQAQKAGLNVPRDLAVIGFGDLAISGMVEPSITTVRVDGAMIADRTLEVIQSRRNNIEPPTHRIDCGFEIVSRDSA